jgi:hypothetical protein
MKVEAASLLDANISTMDPELAHVSAAKVAGTLDPNDPVYVRLLNEAANNFARDSHGSLDQGNDACPPTDVPHFPPYRFTDSGTTVGRANNFTTCISNTAPDVIYTYTTITNQRVMISLCGSGYDTALELRRDGACPGTTQVACNDDNGPACQGLQSSIFAVLDSGVTYFIIVDGWGSSAGSYTLNMFDVGPCVTEVQPGDATEYPEAHDSTHAASDPNGGCNSEYPKFNVQGRAFWI